MSTEIDEQEKEKSYVQIASKCYTIANVILFLFLYVSSRREPELDVKSRVVNFSIFKYLLIVFISIKFKFNICVIQNTANAVCLIQAYLLHTSIYSFPRSNDRPYIYEL